VPFKIDALDFVYRFHGCMVSERAERARAVNTLKKMPDGTIFGDNTDGAGLLRDITKNLGWVVKNKRVLVLGAGGAVRGVMQPLMNESPQLVVVANRTLWKAQEIIEDYVDKFSILAADLVNPIEPFDLVINGTSASLGGEMLQLSPTILAPNACCYDMMYSKELTPFLQWAKHHGAQVADGLGMLVEQAAESFYVWRGVMPATKPVMELLR
jgi:shikimate dehydrogenase